MGLLPESWQWSPANGRNSLEADGGLLCGNEADEEAKKVDRILTRIFGELERESGTRCSGDSSDDSGPSRIPRQVALDSLSSILGHDIPGKTVLPKLCPEHLKSNYLTLSDFKKLVYAAGSWAALSDRDLGVLQRRWAAISDDEKNYTIDFPLKEREPDIDYDVKPSNQAYSRAVANRVQRCELGERSVRCEVNRMILRSNRDCYKKICDDSEKGEQKVEKARKRLLEGITPEEKAKQDLISSAYKLHVESELIEKPVNGSEGMSSKAVSESNSERFDNLSPALKAWDIAKSLTAGGLAGSIAKTVIAPLDRTKIIFQTSERKFSARAVVHELGRIVKTDGFFGLWRGHSATLARVMPYAGIQFFSFDRYKAMLLRDGDERLTPVRRLLAGSLAGATSVVCTYPLDFIRARMAVMSFSQGGLIYNLRRVVATEGSVGLYSGLTPTLLGILPYAGLAFGTFETLKIATMQRNGNQVISAHERFYCGVVAGIVAQSFTYPLDIVRRRMQTDSVINSANGGNGRAYYGVAQTMRSVAMKEGVISGLFKGLSMNWIKGPIAQGISFTAFDLLKRTFSVSSR